MKHLIHHKQIRSILNLSLILSALIVIGCQNDQQRLGPKSPQQLGSPAGGSSSDSGGNPNNNPTGQPSGSNGTQDTGGCNGVGGKCYDSYIVDFRTLDAYKEHIQPIEKNVLQKSKEFHKPKVDHTFSVLSGPALTKTWYLAPVELSTISKDILGVSFISTSTEQLAIQTDREVWIDSRKFDQLNKKEQAELILHEMVMALYLIKYKPFSELCPTFQEVDPTTECTNMEIIDSVLPIEKESALSKSDYESIRRVTNWLMVNGATIDLKEFYTRLFYNGFDKRIFNPKLISQNVGTPEGNIEVEGLNIANLINQEEILNDPLNTCTSLNTSTSFDCTIKAQLKDFKVKVSDTISHVYKHLNLDLNSNNLRINSDQVHFDKIHISPVPLVNDDMYISFLTTPFKKRSVGDQDYVSVMVLKKIVDGNKTIWRLAGLLLKPLKVVSINNESGSCLAMSPSPTSIDSDTILVSKKGRNLENIPYFKVLSTKIYESGTNICSFH